MSRLLFVGERPSETAYRKGWTWESGRLAGRTLAEALARIEIDAASCGFVNLFGNTPQAPEFLSPQAEGRAEVLRAAAKAGVQVVALGQKVSRILKERNVPHLRLRHPAARGQGRAKDVYAAHVAEVLG